VPLVGTSNRGDAARVARSGEPIPDGSADRAALHGRLAAAGRLARDQEQQACARRHRLLEPGIQQPVGALEIVAVEIDGDVRLDEAAG
jgi:hypothetical protein